MTKTLINDNGTTIKEVDHPSEAQLAEMHKYDQAYSAPSYRMGDLRKMEARNTLGLVKWRGSYLDVGCGRGEMLDIARDLGFVRTLGVEVVPDLIAARRDVIYAPAWHLPFENQAFEVVTSFDVIEHILPGDDELVCRELDRVASRAIIITANNLPSRLPDGTELHVNRRPYDEWDQLFREWFARGSVYKVDRYGGSVSETWQIDYAD